MRHDELTCGREAVPPRSDGSAAAYHGFDSERPFREGDIEDPDTTSAGQNGQDPPAETGGGSCP